MKINQDIKNIPSTEEILRKEKNFNDTVTCAICSVGFSSATASIVSVATGCIDRPETLPYFIAGGIAALPVFYILLRKLRKKMDADFRKDMVAAENLFSMMGEFLTNDRLIDEKTTNFLNDLELKFKDVGIQLPESQMFCINKLLYLINVNYYDEISRRAKELTREKLINHVINQIVIYYQRNLKKTFDENDAQEIMSYCLLIDPAVKEKIIQEFKASKIKLGNEIDYAIEKNETKHLTEIDTYDSFLKATANDKRNHFDITSETDINSVIIALSNLEHYRKYGNPHDLNWDMDFLKRILTLIASNYRQELIDYHNDYSNLDLASSLIASSITYALVNKKSEVGQREILNTFKQWKYIPFTIQDKILTKLFEEDGIDYNLHPYRNRRDPSLVKKHNIIKFSSPFIKKDSTTEE